jgi:hypothetical protein
VDIAKNAGRGAFNVGKGAVRRKERIDLEEVAGGVVELSKIVSQSPALCITIEIDKA